MPLFACAQKDNKLIVTMQEYEQMMMVAEENAAPRSHFQGPDSVPVQINKNGVLQQNRKRKITQCKQPAGTAALYGGGGLVQDVRIPQGKSPAVITPARNTRNMDIEDRLAEEVKDIAGMLKDNPAAVEQLWSTLAALKAQIAMRIDSQLPVIDLSKIVSFDECDRHKNRFKRLKSSCEPDRKLMWELKEPAITKMRKGHSCLGLDWI